jgi:NAD-dependent dihydropyrimidine dehydrogenase PreA subunit
MKPEKPQGKPLPVIDQKKCTLCGDCVQTCPDHALVIQDQRVIFEKPNVCNYCGDCEGVCPQGAIRVEYVIRW